MKKIIDFSFNGKISKRNSIIFRQLCTQNKNSFNDFINQSFRNNVELSNFFLTPPFTRNTLSSPIFHYFVTSKFIKSNKQDVLKYSYIKVDNYLHKKFIQYHLKKNSIKKKYIFLVKDKFLIFLIKISILNLFLCFSEMIKRTIIYFISKLTNLKYKNYNKLNGKYILIDKYIFPNYISNDRYYNDIEELSDKSNNINYVPTLEYFNIVDFFNTFKILRSQKKYIIKDDFISFFELIKCHIKCFSILKINISKNDNEKLESLIKLDYLKLSNYIHPLLEGLITIKFIENLRKQDIEVKSTINWYENNIKDKCWNLGFRKYFKKNITKGYMGFFPSEFFLNMSNPTNFEERLEILPSKIFVIGKKIINLVSKDLKSTNVLTAPAFRFHYIFNDSLKNPKIRNNNILVSLPILREESDKIYSDIKKICYFFPQYKFFLMPHPTNIVYSKKYILENNIKFVENDVAKYLMNSSIIISGMSSICIEAISLNKVVIILNNLKTIEISVINNNIDKKLYKRYIDHKGLLRILNFILKKKSFEETKYIAELYFENFFEKIDKNKTNLLLN